MEGNRKQWIRPQLIVLGRGTPEESVLAGCKMTATSGPATTKTTCKKFNFGTNCKTKCSVISTTS